MQVAKSGTISKKTAARKISKNFKKNLIKIINLKLIKKFFNRSTFSFIQSKYRNIDL